MQEQVKPVQDKQQPRGLFKIRQPKNLSRSLSHTHSLSPSLSSAVYLSKQFIDYAQLFEIHLLKESAALSPQHTHRLPNSL